MVNKKRVLRLYQQEALALRRELSRRRASARAREGRPPVQAADQAWAMDFVSVALADGRRARVLTALDMFTQEAVAVRADARFTAGMVVRSSRSWSTCGGCRRACGWTTDRSSPGGCSTWGRTSTA